MNKSIKFLGLFVALTAGVLGCQRGMGESSGSMPDFVSISPSASSLEPSSSQASEPLKVISGEEPVPSQSSAASSLADIEPVSEGHGDLPKVIVGQQYIFGGGGGEDYCITGIEKLEDGNPWTEEADLKTLPVYQNLYVSSSEIPKSMRMTEGLTAKRASQEEMEAAARDVAQKLGTAVDSMEVYPSEELIQRFKTQNGEVPEEYQYVNSVTLSCGGGTISIEADTKLDVSIVFTPEAKLPEQYTLTADASYEEQLERGKYVAAEYGKLFQMENPVPYVNGVNNTIWDGRASWCGIYDGTGDLEKQIVQYSLSNALLRFNERGELSTIWLHNWDLSEKLGDYPIITPEEAREKLKEGKYINGSYTDFPGEEQIAKVELIYRNEVILMPYYRFYAEIPVENTREFDFSQQKETPDGQPLKGYAAYYVPAVREEYIEKMPSHDGRFNQ